MSRKVEIGKTVTLGVKFYQNGQLYDPYSIVSVIIKTARSGGTDVVTLVPTKISTGVYHVTWTVPVGTTPGTYYDAWTWQATSDMGLNTRTYSFQVAASAYASSAVCADHGPLFVGEKEINFFNSINKELIQRVIAQKVIYYSVSEKHTKRNELYDEAISKVVYTPVEVNALVLYKDPVQNADKFSIDTVYSLEVYLHLHELEERNLIPREGDFLSYGNVVYEIEKLTQPQLTFGQINEKVMVKAECRVSRKSQFEVFGQNS